MPFSGTYVINIHDICSAKYGRRADNMKRSDYIKANGLGYFFIQFI